MCSEQQIKPYNAPTEYMTGAQSSNSLQDSYVVAEIQQQTHYRHMSSLHTRIRDGEL